MLGKGPGSHNLLLTALAGEVEIWPVILEDELCIFSVSLLIGKVTDVACLIQLKKS